MTFSPALTERLLAAGLDLDDTANVVRSALAEDLPWGPDVTTTATVDAEVEAAADLVSRARGVVAGIPVALAVMEAAGLPTERCNVVVDDGAPVAGGDVIATLRAPLVRLLTVERTLLNLVTHLSGVATATAAWVAETAGTGCAVRDTRKTTPGLRRLEKYAVRCGGGLNHRMGLGDAALVKDNHVAAAGGVSAAVARVRAAAPGVPLEVECDTVAQVAEALGAGVDLILLDNMGLDDLRASVALAAGRDVLLEASGGLTLGGARSVAATGVHFLAVGALTHSSPALDIGLDLRGSEGRPLAP